MFFRYEIFGGDVGISYKKWQPYFYCERPLSHGQMCYKWAFGDSIDIGSHMFLNEEHDIRHIFYDCDKVTDKVILALEDTETYGKYGNTLGHRMLLVAPYLITRAGGPDIP